MKKLKYWIPVIIMLVFIWGNSLLNGTISEYISSFIHMLFSGKNQADIIANGYDHLLRKLAHFSEYFALCASVIYAYYHTLKKPNDYRKYTWLFLLVAPLDEFIQLFVADRSGSFKDVLIDWSGFCLGFMIIHFMINHFLKCRQVKYPID